MEGSTKLTFQFFRREKNRSVAPGPIVRPTPDKNISCKDRSLVVLHLGQITPSISFSMTRHYIVEDKKTYKSKIVQLENDLETTFTGCNLIQRIEASRQMTSVKGRLLILIHLSCKSLVPSQNAHPQQSHFQFEYNVSSSLGCTLLLGYRWSLGWISYGA